jgi:hypothetical protein
MVDPWYVVGVHLGPGHRHPRNVTHAFSRFAADSITFGVKDWHAFQQGAQM